MNTRKSSGSDRLSGKCGAKICESSVHSVAVARILQRGQTVPTSRMGAQIQEAERQRRIDLPVNQGHGQDEQGGRGHTEVALKL